MVQGCMDHEPQAILYDVEVRHTNFLSKSEPLQYGAGQLLVDIPDEC